MQDPEGPEPLQIRMAFANMSPESLFTSAIALEDPSRPPAQCTRVTTPAATARRDHFLGQNTERTEGARGLPNGANPLGGWPSTVAGSGRPRGTKHWRMLAVNPGRTLCGLGAQWSEAASFRKSRQRPAATEIFPVPQRAASRQPGFQRMLVTGSFTVL